MEPQQLYNLRSRDSEAARIRRHPPAQCDHNVQLLPRQLAQILYSKCAWNYDLSMNLPPSLSSIGKYSPHPTHFILLSHPPLIILLSLPFFPHLHSSCSFPHPSHSDPVLLTLPSSSYLYPSFLTVLSSSFFPHLHSSCSFTHPSHSYPLLLILLYLPSYTNPPLLIFPP
jgi:hypothetical protein